MGQLLAESLNDALADIVHDSERLHRIIENLLLIARAEQGEQLEVEPLLLVRVVNRVIDRHRRHFPTRQFEVIEHNSPLPVEFSELVPRAGDREPDLECREVLACSIADHGRHSSHAGAGTDHQAFGQWRGASGRVNGFQRVLSI